MDLVQLDEITTDLGFRMSSAALLSFKSTWFQLVFPKGQVSTARLAFVMQQPSNPATHNIYPFKTGLNIANFYMQSCSFSSICNT